MSSSEPDDIIRWEDLIYITDLLDSSGQRHMSLLGGEPTLHPHFIDFVIYLLERNFRITVFTSGIMSEKMLSEASMHLSNVSPERLNFVCNLNDPAKSPFSEVESIKKFMKIFGHLTSPGFNIYQPHFEMEFLIDYINNFGLKRNIRLGLAHPIPGVKNSYVKIEEMPKMAERLISYLPVLDSFRIKPGFDCGFPMCLFTDEQLGVIFKVIGPQGMKFGCGPAIDIGPDMKVWSCFPLSNFHKKSIYDFNSMDELMQYYQNLHAKIRIEAGGLYEKCDDCKFRQERLCTGGCLAHTLSQLHDEERVRYEEVYI